MKILSAISVKNFLDNVSCNTIYKSVMELEDSWSNYDNRMCLGSGKELNEDDDSYDIKCKTNNPIIFEKFPSVLFKINNMINTIYEEEIEKDSISIPGFEIIKEDGTYFNLKHDATFYFTIPIYIGNCHSSLFYVNRFGNKREHMPLYKGYFYFHVKPFHKHYEKLNENNNLICIEGKGKMNKNNKITLFF